MNKQTPDHKESIASAVKAIKAGRPLRAEETCRDYLEIHPGSADHMRVLGYALMKQNRLKEAEEQIRFALEIKPSEGIEPIGSLEEFERRVALLGFEKPGIL